MLTDERTIRGDRDDGRDRVQEDGQGEEDGDACKQSFFCFVDISLSILILY